MKRHGNGLLILAVTWAMAAGAFAQAPPLINYQGRLLNGTTLENGVLPIAFRLYTNATPQGGEALLYEDSNSVAVVDGLYSTYIGDDTTSGTLTNALLQPQVFLEVVVNGTSLAPRERLTSVAYALTAANAVTSLYAQAAGYAGGSAAATSAGYASSAGTSVSANAAGYADVAAAATNAAYAGSAGTSVFANVAGYAAVAGFATNAGYAANAGTSVSANAAGYADVAALATNAGYATSASSAATSTYATAAGYAATSKFAVAGDFPVWPAAQERYVYYTASGTAKFYMSEPLASDSNYLAGMGGFSDGLGVRFLNVTDPGNVTLVVGRGPSLPQSLCSIGNYVYVGDGDGVGGHPPGYFIVYDWSNRSSPTSVYSGIFGSQLYDMADNDSNMVFVADTYGIFSAVSVTNPSAPQVVYSESNSVSYTISGVACHPSGSPVYATDYSMNSVYVYTVSGTNVAKVAAIPCLTTPARPGIAKGYLFVPKYSGNTMDVFSLATPTNPVKVATITAPATINVYSRPTGSGDYLYVGAGNRLRAYDISNPADPFLAFNFDLSLTESDVLYISLFPGRGLMSAIASVTATPNTRYLILLDDPAAGASGLNGTYVMRSTYARSSGTAGTSTWAVAAGTSTYANVAAYAPSAGTSVYAVASGTSVYANVAGYADVAAASTNSVYASNAGTSVYANAAGYAEVAGFASNIPAYTPADAGDWSAPVPSNLVQAIDRIADALSTHLGSPIP